jgi:hypothetical protein
MDKASATCDADNIDDKEVLSSQVMSVLNEKKVLIEEIAKAIELRTERSISSKRLMDIMRDGVLDDLSYKRDFRISWKLHVNQLKLLFPKFRFL